MHTIKDENRRRQHNRMFQKSLTSNLASSFSSTTSNASSVSSKLELMCAQLLTESCDAPPEVSICDKDKDEVEESPLAMTLVGLLPKIPKDVPAKNKATSSNDLEGSTQSPKSMLSPKKNPSSMKSGNMPMKPRRATVDTPPSSKLSKMNNIQRNRSATFDDTYAPPFSSPKPSSDSRPSSISFANAPVATSHYGSGATKDSIISEDDFDKRCRASTCTVSNMEWTVKIPPYLRGYYTGAVNQQFQPHGKGTWVRQDETVNAKISGRWYEGSFIPHEYPDQDLTGFKGKAKEDTSSSPKELAPNSLEEPKTCQHYREDHRHTFVKTKQIQTSPKQRKYKVGEVLRCRNDIIEEKDDSAHMQMICQLKEEDGAWIRRSDGKISFAKVAKRQYELQDDGVIEETLVFEINSKGSKKNIRRSLWCSYIWLPSYLTSSQVNRSARAA